MKDGLIYLLTRKSINFLRYLNLVEWFKLAATFLFRNRISKIENESIHRNAVDIFIFFKWTLILIIWTLKYQNTFLTFLTWYLIVSNIFTYFYYHIWSDEAIDSDQLPRNRARRRFVNLILAIGFSDICFAYLINSPYSHHFKWDSGTRLIKSLWYSISNSIAANYDAIIPISDLGYSVSMIQLIITFFFVTIIISRSIPQINQPKL
jgi:hypothetical protein